MAKKAGTKRKKDAGAVVAPSPETKPDEVAPEKTPEVAPEAEAGYPANCINCGVPLTGIACTNCGLENTPEVVTGHVQAVDKASGALGS